MSVRGGRLIELFEKIEDSHVVKPSPKKKLDTKAVMCGRYTHEFSDLNKIVQTLHTKVGIPPLSLMGLI